MITVVGDYIRDVDIHLKEIKKSPDYNCPVYVETRMETRDGGAGAVVDMIRELGVECIGFFGNTQLHLSIKKRYFINGVCNHRIDLDNTTPFAFERDFGGNRDEDILNRTISDVDLIIVSDYGKGIITREFYDHLLSLKIPIFVDPARNKSLEWYSGATAIFPNRVEAGIGELWSKEQTAHHRCDELKSYYHNICIKLGDLGSVVYSKDIGKSKYIPARKITPVDVCGAGDMFIAAAAVAFHNGFLFHESCQFATEMATLKCEQEIGATPIHVYDSSRLRRYLHKRSTILEGSDKVSSEI